MHSLKDKYKKCASLMEGTPVFMRGTVNNTEDDFGDLTGPYKIALKDLKGFFKETFKSWSCTKEDNLFFLEGALKESDGIFTRVRVVYSSRGSNYASIEVDVDSKGEFGGIWEEVLQKEGFYKDSARPYGIIPFTFKASLAHIKKILSRIITIVQKRKANMSRDLSLDTEEKFYANRGMIPNNECFVIEAGNSEVQISKTKEGAQALTVTVVDDLEETKPLYAHDAKELSDGIASVLTRLWIDDMANNTEEQRMNRNPAEEANLERAVAEVTSSTEFTTPTDLGTCDFSNMDSVGRLLNQLIDHWNAELYAFEDMQNEIAEIAEDVPEVVLKCIPLIMPEWDPIELTGTPETTPNANRQRRLAKIQANRAASGQFKEDNHLPRSRSLKEGLVTKYNPKTGLYELRDSK